LQAGQKRYSEKKVGRHLAAYLDTDSGLLAVTAADEGAHLRAARYAERRARLSAQAGDT
jgi:hypothetical protein